MQHFTRNFWPIAVQEKELLTITCNICSQYVLDMMNVFGSSPAACLAIWRPCFKQHRVPPGLVIHFYHRTTPTMNSPHFDPDRTGHAACLVS